MDCKKAKKLIPLAVDTELNDSDSQQLQSHLVSCHSCADLLISHRNSIRAIDQDIRAAVEGVSAPADFASRVAAMAAGEQTSASRQMVLLQALRGCFADLTAGRRMAVASACALIVLATSLIATGIGRSLDSSPVASAQMRSGHLVTFTVETTPDGRVLAGVSAHRYCQVTRPRTEAMR